MNIVKSLLNKNLVLRFIPTANFCEISPKLFLEKSVNQVTLLGRVGIKPQLRGSEAKPVVVFTLATNTNYKYDTGEIQQKTEWHRISVFKPYLRDTILKHLQKGSRVYVDGRIAYGEFSDAKGETHSTTSIIANDIIFVGSTQKKDFEEFSEDVASAL